MGSFKLFYPHLVRNEGGYANNKLDVGGETYRGVARKYHPNWQGWKYVDAYKKEWLAAGKKLNTRTEWAAFSKVLYKDPHLENSLLNFYESLYWDSLHLDLVANQSVAESLADMGVNAGTGRIGWMVQYVLRFHFGRLDLDFDGDIGPQTLKALNAVNQANFHARFAQLRNDFYRYRSGEYENESRLLGVHQFLRNKLKLKTNTSQKVFLNTWLKRVSDMKYKD
ncbi:hypothetical protein MUN82_01965 [Hymenobacter aerilatus]|uniref:TtsA-like Glycoside hydrolase family 108 domain-containing protein n=1 Tax=Hymenobacter aerilatus TaxID=2932251 RepID=A0A8T9SVV1_9BACT|nr:glycosyl hydrolase 108 family protein [Hymenobacter aerilatus]UOR05877.1 hypothetical protein MUN82_01965 [Hymenobacter aerilatus]